MKKFIPCIAILFICQVAIHADDSPDSYEMGFKTVSVFEYKQALKKADEDIPKFPPRTGNALIVESVVEDSRAAKAGLQKRDLIRIVNGKLIRSATEADKIFKKISYKDELELGVIRLSDDKWKRITLKLEPITEQQNLVFSLIRYDLFDHEYKPCILIRHRNAPFSKYSNKNIQIYYSEVNEQPETLYLRLGIFVSDKDNPGGFVIKTDKTNYKVIEEKEIDEQEVALNKKVSEAEKLSEVAKRKFTEAEKKSKAAEATHNAKYKNFKIDKNRKDELYKKKLKRVLDSIKNCEYLTTIAVKESKNAQAAARRKTESLEISLEYAQNKLKKAGLKNKQMKERINAAFDRLDPVHARIVVKASELLRQGIEPDKIQLELIESVGFAGPAIDAIKADQGWRGYDAPLKKNQKAMIEDMISSRKVTIYHASDPKHGFDLTPQQQERMKIVLRAFEDAGGKLTQ